MSIFYFFFFGLAVGSFLNVLIYRAWECEDFISKPSHCRSCRRNLYWYELIPVFSFVWLRGKCSSCHAKISLQYPLVELATGLLFVLVVQKLGFSSLSLQWSLPNVISLIFHFALFSSLVVMFVIDARHYALPNVFLYLSIFFAAGAALSRPATFINGLFGALAASAIIGFLVIITRERGMGQGDAYLSFALGFLAGWPLVLAGLFLSFMAGSVFGLILLVLKKKTLKSRIPFGPFLITSFIFVFFWGNQLVSWYFSLF